MMTRFRTWTVIGANMFFNDLFTHALGTLDMWWGQVCVLSFFEMGATGFRRMDFGNRCVQTSQRADAVVSKPKCTPNVEGVRGA